MLLIYVINYLIIFVTCHHSSSLKNFPPFPSPISGELSSQLRRTLFPRRSPPAALRRRWTNSIFSLLHAIDRLPFPFWNFFHCFFPFLDLVVWYKESLFLSFRYSFRISMFRCDRFWALLMVLRVDDLICGGAVFLCDVSNFSCIMWGYDFVAESEVECGWIVWIRC